jgi:prepilin-type N-terminal cleavage/methylation domain-containing protein
MSNNKGYSLVEVIIVISIIAMLVVSMGKALILISQTPASARAQIEARSFAQNPLEIITQIQHSEFACTCASDVCAGNTCTRPSDGQSCTTAAAYTSCWTAYPANLVGQNDFYLENIGGNWQLIGLGGTPEKLVSTDPLIYRRINIVNVERDAAGNIVSPGTADPNTKLITVSLSFPGRRGTSTTELKTMLTAWESL